MTLVILIIGIRENTKITRMSMYADQMAVSNDLTRDAYQDEQSTAILDAFLMEDLSTLELMDIKRLENAMWYVFRNYESAYIAHTTKTEARGVLCYLPETTRNGCSLIPRNRLNLGRIWT